MSNIDKQALREEFQYMQDHYSDPADRDRQIIYIAAEALLGELEKAQRANAAQDDHINQQQDRIEQLEKGHKEAAKQINSWRRLAKQNIAERGKDISELEAARQRIAELESKNGYLRTIAHEQNELAIRASLDSNNATVEMGRLHKRIAELERSETQLINERDDAESALNDAYKAVMGHAPEWSNWFSFENAIDEIELACEQWRNQTDDVIQFRQRIQELEAKLANPVLLPKTNGYWNEQEKAYEEAITLAKRQVRLAGFSVEDM